MGDSMVLKTSGLITKDATVEIGEGLPNTTSKDNEFFSSPEIIFLWTQGQKLFQLLQLKTTDPRPDQPNKIS